MTSHNGGVAYVSFKEGTRWVAVGGGIRRNSHRLVGWAARPEAASRTAALVQTWLGRRVWGPKPPPTSGRYLRDLLLWRYNFGHRLTRPGRDGVRWSLQSPCFPRSQESTNAWDGLRGRCATRRGMAAAGTGPTLRSPGSLCQRGFGSESCRPLRLTSGSAGPQLLKLGAAPLPATQQKSLAFSPVTGSDYSEYLGVSVLLESCIKMFLMQQSALLLSPRTDSQIISFHNILN